jgi:glycosyltransferase involved in cell wall biosynthesis
MATPSTTHPKIKVTIIFLAYNQEDFVADAARSCLEQQGEGIEIIFSDDCSTDKTYAILEKITSEYTGPHLIYLRRNSKNLGIANHYNTLVKLAQGQLLVTAAGDDISLPNRILKITNAWNLSNQRVDLIASHALSMSYSGLDTKKIIKVDQLNKWKNARSWCKKRPYVIGATHAFTKRLWDDFGDIASDISYEDQVLSFRAICKGGGLTIEEPLIKYREGGLSASPHQISSKFKNSILIKKYTQQKAIFEQIKKDLATIGLSSLWKGKVKRYHSRSITALYFLNQSINNSITKKELISLVLSSGPVWLLRYLIKIYASAKITKSS